MQMDDLLGGLRQESSEDALKTSLDKTIGYLQQIKHRYYRVPAKANQRKQNPNKSSLSLQFITNIEIHNIPTQFVNILPWTIAGKQCLYSSPGNNQSHHENSKLSWPTLII